VPAPAAPTVPAKAPLLNVKDLVVSFNTNDGVVRAVNGLSFSLKKGEVLGIVGESGSGKSVTNLALLQLLARNGNATGEATFKGKNLLTLPENDIRKIRGNDIAMVFQDPMTSLNPYMRVSEQIDESLRLHTPLSSDDRIARVVELLNQVGIPNAKGRLRDYPHEFSGGMRQRAMIAMALACEPEVLIADEPTTALDVTIQAQILDLMRRLNREKGMGLIMITHNLGVVADLCERVIVMYGGRVMEEGNARDLFYGARHPYTHGLLRSIPRLGASEHHKLYSIPGTPPRPFELPAGCPFAPRCAFATDQCAHEIPPLAAPDAGDSHRFACWHPVTPEVRA
jgi:oligopeptide transport system ATP-binding protein